MAQTLQQRCADLVLQLPHRLADRGLGGEHSLGGGRKPALTHHLDEGAQRPKLHVHSVFE
jgi:hypothetical protein